jgi:hypothetical protein
MRVTREELELVELQRLADAIRNMHHAEPRLLCHVWVTSSTDEGAPWVGWVSQFELEGHPDSALCYAWAECDGTLTRYVVVLQSPEIDSPHKAVASHLVPCGGHLTAERRRSTCTPGPDVALPISDRRRTASNPLLRNRDVR